MLELGGQLDVIVPAENYREGLPASHHRTYDALLDAAMNIQRLPFRESTPEAHIAASEYMLGLIDELIADLNGELGEK